MLRSTAAGFAPSGREEARFSVCRSVYRVPGFLFLLLLLAGYCGPLPLDHPLSVPLSPKMAGPYRVEGRRILYQTPAFTVAAEPLGDEALRRWFKQRAGEDRNLFGVKGRQMLASFMVTIVNTSRTDLVFNAISSTLDAEGEHLYPLSRIELSRELSPIYPDLDVDAILARTTHDAVEVVNPHHYLKKLLIFYPLPEEARSFTLALGDMGGGEKAMDVVFPFEIIEASEFGAKAAGPMAIPSTVRPQQR